jgi:hypothetical protein
MRRLFSIALVAVVVARVAAAVWAALTNIRGDYYASMPGAYVRTVNPTLWDSPDMQGAWGYHVDTYFHGPVQYLTLYHVAYLDSYAAIARLLMPVYFGVLVAAFWCLYRAMQLLAPATRLVVPLFASTFLFFPLLQSYVQREFEIVVLLALSAALWMLIRNRRAIGAALLAYAAWYKYAPVIFVGYLGLRRWFGAVASFLVTSLVIVALAHAVFGIGLFFNNNVPAHAVQVFNVFDYEFRRGPGGWLYGVGFCAGWFETETTLANVRHGLCSIASRTPWVYPHIVYLLLCISVAAIYLLTHSKLERRSPLADHDERWRRALEFSIVTTVYVCFLFNHYYYLIVLIVPLNVLLTRYLTRPNLWRLSAWAVAYASISAFVIPMSVLTRLAGEDVWPIYIKGAWFLYGELLLVALLLREYWEIAQRSAEPVSIAS